MSSVGESYGRRVKRDEVEKGWYLEQLVPGTHFADAVFVIRNVDSSGKANRPKLSCTFHDATDARKAKSWNLTEQMAAALEARPTLVQVSGRVDDKAGYEGEIVIETLVAIEGIPQDISPFLDPLPTTQNQTWSRFGKLVRSVTTPNLVSLLKVIFDKETRARFYEAVAAKGHHHAFRGGLLEHTVEVAELCQRACEIVPSLNPDLLVAGALLHDIGKLEEMEHGLQAGEYTMPGSLQGHLYLGACRVEQAAATIPEFPRELSGALVHLILSHHGCATYGSPTAPAFAEAVILSQCDLISARAYECRAAKQEAAAGQLTVRRSVGEAQRVYVGPLGLPEPADGNEPETTPASWDEEELSLPTPPPLPTAKMPLPSDLGTDLRTGQNRFGTALSVSEGGLTTLPVLGRVAAGPGDRSAEASGEIETRAVLLPPGGADYLLCVAGDSMNGIGILEGDLLFVRRQVGPRDGDVVVANIPGEGQVVKRYRAANPRTSQGNMGPALHSENPAYAPIPLTEDITIQGRAVSLLRDF